LLKRAKNNWRAKRASHFIQQASQAKQTSYLCGAARINPDRHA
jgi:hypothetical protein